MHKQINILERNKEVMSKALQNPYIGMRSMVKDRLYYFVQYFWSEYSPDAFEGNWHIEYICDELEKVARRVGNNEEKEYDLIINVPPGTSKTSTVMIMFPLWVWINWYHLSFITSSYTSALSLESAEYSREVMRSDKFKKLFPELEIKADKDTKSNFRIIKKVPTDSKRRPYHTRQKIGGNRFSTSVGGSLTGFHGHFLMVDDPVDPNRAVSKVELDKANHWISQTLMTRKKNKLTTPLILIMQRLHQNDPTGGLLKKYGKNGKIKHISLPGEINTQGVKHFVKPANLLLQYKKRNGLLDPKRLSASVLKELMMHLGQYGYAGQISQNPVPAGGGMFKVDRFPIIEQMMNPANIVRTVRYWDKAGTQDGGAYTAGVKMHLLNSGKVLIANVARGQWATEQRELIIKKTAEADGVDCYIYFEQEPGSGGKESAEATIRNLRGFAAYADRPTGDKVYRADPYSVAVNNGDVMLLQGEWIVPFKEEHQFFPKGTYKDQVDAAAGAYNILVGAKVARVF